MKNQKKRTLLFQRIKENEDTIWNLYKKCGGHIYEDRMYRFYHSSLKVFWLQDVIKETVELLTMLNVNDPPQFDKWFVDIVAEAQAKGEFKKEYRDNFQKHARPVVEAFLHCKYFLDMLVKCIKIEEEPTEIAPSGWLALTELYNIRY